MARSLAIFVAFCAAAIAATGCQEEKKSRAKASRSRNAASGMKGSDSHMARFKNPTEADISELTKLFRSGDKNAREDAILALGTIGSTNCIELIVAALGDDDDSIRFYAMLGIERAIVAKRATKDFLEAAFEPLVRLLNREDRTVFGKPPILLLAIDTDRAIPVLLSVPYFTIENSQLHYILRALNRNHIKIPQDKLLPLLAQLKGSADKYPHDYEYAEALIAYGRNPDVGAEERLRNELKSDKEKVAAGASEGLAILHGVESPYGHVAEIVESKGFAALTDPQKHYYSVFAYGGQVDNGGHAQYFFNSSGDSWKSALSGLKAIGATKRAAVLEEAAAKFGPDGPSEDRVTRINQVRRLRAEPKKIFGELDTRFYEAGKAGEDFDVLLPLYAIENKAHFTPEAARQ
jgi:hypothetical protein